MFRQQIRIRSPPSSSPPSPSRMSLAPFEGYLTKKGAFRRNWKRRFFVSYGPIVAYFSPGKAKVWEEEVVPLGMVMMTSMEVAVLSDANVRPPARPFMFALHPVGGNGGSGEKGESSGDRTFILQASSESDQQGWVTRLRQASAPGAGDDMPMLKLIERALSAKDWSTAWRMVQEARTVQAMRVAASDRPGSRVTTHGGSMSTTLAAARQRKSTAPQRRSSEARMEIPARKRDSFTLSRHNRTVSDKVWREQHGPPLNPPTPNWFGPGMDFLKVHEQFHAEVSGRRLVRRRRGTDRQSAA